MHFFNLIRKISWVQYTAVVIFLLPVLLLGYHLLEHTNGAFSLPRDEAFLQLSTARTLAFNHIWGVGRYSFEAASPSLLYPFLLAIAFLIFGAYLVVIPIINTGIAIILLIVLEKWLVNRGIRPIVRLSILLAVIFLTPLPLIVISGMERTLLLLFAFLFVSRLADEWGKTKFSRRTLIYGALLVATRYDGLLLIAVVCLLLLFRRKSSAAFELALWGLLPVTFFGIIALSKGSYFLPNTFMAEPAGAQFSYDWLVGCGVAVTVPIVLPYLRKNHRRNIQWIAGLTIVLGAMLLTRNVYAFRENDESSIGVYRQEYPVGQFVHRYYPSHTIVSDDVGVLSYLGEGSYLDLSGLASVKVLRGKSDNFLGPVLIRLLSRQQNTGLAIVSDRYDHGLPEDWIRTASWEIPAYDRCPKKTVSFYAMDTASARELKNHLEEYSYFLPHDLNVRYYYFPPSPSR